MYTIFGSTGFIGNEISNYLKKMRKKVFLPNKKKTKFKKNLGHIIYCVGSDDWQKKPKKGFYSNFGHLTEIVFNNNFKSIIFLSTTRIYINSSHTFEEKNLLVNSEKANDYYNILKLASESLLIRLNKNVKIIRLSNVFGFNYKSPLLLPTLIRDGITKKKIQIFINQNSTKDYIHIDDVIKMIFKILRHGRRDIYNVASGNNITLKRIVQILKKETNCKVVLKNQNKKIFEPKININQIRKEFNFKSKLNIKKDLPILIKKFNTKLKN